MACMVLLKHFNQRPKAEITETEETKGWLFIGSQFLFCFLGLVWLSIILLNDPETERTFLFLSFTGWQDSSRLSFTQSGFVGRLVSWKTSGDSWKKNKTQKVDSACLTWLLPYLSCFAIHDQLPHATLHLIATYHETLLQVLSQQ